MKANKKIMKEFQKIIIKKFMKDEDFPLTLVNWNLNDTVEWGVFDKDENIITVSNALVESIVEKGKFKLKKLINDGVITYGKLSAKLEELPTVELDTGDYLMTRVMPKSIDDTIVAVVDEDSTVEIEEVDINHHNNMFIERDMETKEKAKAFKTKEKAFKKNDKELLSFYEVGKKLLERINIAEKVKKATPSKRVDVRAAMTGSDKVYRHSGEEEGSSKDATGGFQIYVDHSGSMHGYHMTISHKWLQALKMLSEDGLLKDVDVILHNDECIYKTTIQKEKWAKMTDAHYAENLAPAIDEHIGKTRMAVFMTDGDIVSGAVDKQKYTELGKKFVGLYPTKDEEKAENATKQLENWFHVTKAGTDPVELFVWMVKQIVKHA